MRNLVLLVALLIGLGNGGCLDAEPSLAALFERLRPGLEHAATGGATDSAAPEPSRLAIRAASGYVLARLNQAGDVARNHELDSSELVALKGMRTEDMTRLKGAIQGGAPADSATQALALKVLAARLIRLGLWGEQVRIGN